MSRFSLATLALIGTVSFSNAAPLAESIPAGAIVYAEADGLADPIAKLRDSQLVRAITESPIYAEFKNSPDYDEMVKTRKTVEFVLGMDLWTAGEKLLGGEVGMAVYPNDEGGDQPDFLLVVRPASRFAYLRQRLWLDPLFAVAGERIKAGPLFETKGVKAWKTKGDKGKPAYVLLASRWLAVSNQKDLLQEAVTLPLEDDPQSMAGSTGFADACAQLGRSDDQLVRVFVDTGAIAEASGGRLGIPEKAEDGFGSFLFGGLMELFANSPHAGIAVSAADGDFALELAGAGDPAKLPERFQVFFPEPPESGTRAVPEVPGMVAGATLYRDLATWYRDREDYLQPAALPGFDKFEVGIGNLLPGHDIGEDVLPLFGSNYTMVAALQDYEHLDGKPGVQLPAFALVASLEHPEEAGDVVQLFFQTLLSVLNLQAAQQKRQPWLIEADLYKDTKITYARYLEKPEGEDLPTVFNFRPAAARVGDEYIVSSSLELCRSLIDALGDPAREDVHGEDLLVRIQGGTLSELVEANREHFEAARVNEGRTAAEAESDIDAIQGILNHIEQVKLTTRSASTGFKVRLAGKLKPILKVEPEPAPDTGVTEVEAKPETAEKE